MLYLVLLFLIGLSIKIIIADGNINGNLSDAQFLKILI